MMNSLHMLRATARTRSVWQLLLVFLAIAVLAAGCSTTSTAVTEPPLEGRSSRAASCSPARAPGTAATVGSAIDYIQSKS